MVILRQSDDAPVSCTPGIPATRSRPVNRCTEVASVPSKSALVAREGSDQGLEEMRLGTVTLPLGENTPGRRSDRFLRVLRGYRGGDHTWER